MTDMNSTTENAADNRPASILRLRPRVQDMHDGTFQPIVVIDDGANGSARFGDGLPTLKDAGNAACHACGAALPDGEWQADGWYGAA